VHVDMMTFYNISENQLHEELNCKPSMSIWDVANGSTLH